MPKQPQPADRYYGSPEWLSERAGMFGTPEWRAVNSQYPDRKLESGQVGGFLPGSKFGVFESRGNPLTTAEKQAQNPLYNPLYSPRSAEYQANLARISQPQIRNPLVTTASTPVTTPLTTPQIGPENAPQSPLQKSPNAPITTPEAFQKNYQMGPATSPYQGIKMPDIKKPLQGFNSGGNWADFLTIAYNRNLR